MIACGERHTVFLLRLGTLLTCGSNEFGQLGLSGDAAKEEGYNKPQGGTQTHTAPAYIEKSIIENVVYIAAGRHHNIAIRKVNEMDDEGDL